MTVGRQGIAGTDLADDIAAEARLATALCTDIRDLDTKLASLPHPARPCRHHDINSGWPPWPAAVLDVDGRCQTSVNGN
jgi:hypothetical protein